LEGVHIYGLDTFFLNLQKHNNESSDWFSI
jgi:hypothetical protein